MKKLLLLVSAALLCGQLNASNFVVTNLNDSGSGSLRQAIADANADASSTAFSPHTIDATGVSGFLDLMSPMEVLYGHAIINGPTNAVLSIRRSESSLYNDMHLIMAFDNYTLTINNLRFAKATNTAVYVSYASKVTLNNCVLDSNNSGSTNLPRGGAITIDMGGSLTLNHCIVSNNSANGNGGGIFNGNGNLTIQYSTIKDNIANYYTNTHCGGGIYSSDNASSTLKISNSTISGNSAYSGGGLYLKSGVDTLINCTISGNMATNNSGGGISQESSDSYVILYNCSVIGNTATSNSAYGGGISSASGQMNINNTIVAGNTADQGADDIIGNIYSAYGHNLTGASDNDGFVSFINNTSSVTKGNIYGVSFSNVANATLADNGGLSLTHALTSSSLARNAGVIIPLIPATDQRDSSRSGVADIGAVEFRAAAGTPEITLNPSDVIMCKGSNGSTFTFSTTGTVSAYQWQVSTNGGRSYVNLSNNSNYSGVATSSLTINNAPVSGNNYKFRCRVTGSEIVYTGYAVLFVEVLPTFIHDINNLNLCSTSNPTASAYFQDAGGINSYQWQLNSGSGFNNITPSTIFGGTNKNTLDIFLVTGMEGYVFRCAVTNSCGTTYTSSSTLSLTGPTFNPILSGPSDKLVTAGDKAIFSVNAPKATGFNWQVAPTANSWSSIPCDRKYSVCSSDTTYSNFTLNDSLTISPVALVRDGYHYRALVSNACGATFRTEGAELFVRSAPSICMVTIDDNTGKNQIVFEKPGDQDWIDSFLVFKETNIANQYMQIGRLGRSQMSTFTDNASDPVQQSNIYKIVVKDTSGHYSPKSAAHQTMHLSINKGINNTIWNLIWNAYTGINVTSYNIFRGLSPTSMTQINTVSGSILAYTDASAPLASTVYYQIQILGTSCDPTARTSGLTSIVSNFAKTSSVTGIVEAFETSGIKLYPSPSYNGSFTIVINEGELKEVVLVDALGRKEFFHTEEITTSLRGLLVAIITTDRGSYTKKIEVR